MQPKFSRGEYWLLENVVDSTMPFCFLGEADFCPALYKPGHGLGRPALIELLGQLFQDGLILATRFNDDATFTPTLDQIAAALDEAGPSQNEHCMYYKLTEKGGAHWELFARPDWRRYISNWPGELVGMRRELVQEYLSGLHHDGIQVKRGSERWDILRPWQATSWKNLEYGHRVTFEHSVIEDCDFDLTPFRHRMLRRRYDWGRW